MWSSIILFLAFGVLLIILYSHIYQNGDVWTFSVKSFNTTLLKHTIDVNKDGFAEDVRVGDEVFVDGLKSTFEVIEKIGHDVISRCIDPGLLLPRQSCTNNQFGSRKNTRRIPKGVIHVLASFSNTIVTVTDVRGRVVSWSSAGNIYKNKKHKFKGTEKGTPFAAQMAAKDAIRKVVNQGMKRAEVRIKGPGPGRDAALRAIHQSGIQLTFVRDVTPMPHNGCRPPKKRRV